VPRPAGILQPAQTVVKIKKFMVESATGADNIIT
jgi:hypothetical protein